MTQAIVTYLNAVIDTVGRVDERYCMAELRSDGTTTVPYIYVGNGKVKPISIDGGSLSYWRISGAVPPMEQIASQYGKPRLSATYPLRLVIIARRADSTIDDGFMPTRLAEDMANALTGSHPDLKTLLKANTVSVSAGYDVNITGVWADEFKGTGVNDPNYTRTIMALSVSVTVVGDRACWENECDYDPDILHLFDFCQAGTVARLTPAQVACLQAIAEDANWELYNTNGTLLSTGSIPSGDTDSIVAPDATVLRDGVPFGTVASGDSIDVPSAGSDLVIMGDLIETLYPSSPIDFNFTVNGVPQSVGYDVGTQTIQASAPDATITVNTAPFGTAPSGGALNVPVINGGSNPVGSKQGSDWVIDNNATFINGTQVTDQEAEVDANIFVTLDGAQSGTWNAGLQTWEVVGASCADANLQINGVQQETIASGGTFNLIATLDGVAGGSYNAATDTLSFASNQNWIRPSAWIAIPSLTSANERIVAVVAIFENEYNGIALNITNLAANIDWGDGTSVVSNGAVQTKVYDYNSLAGSVSAWTDGRNYKQVLLDITRVGGAITSVDFRTFSTIARDSNTNFVDMSISLPNCTALALSVNPIAAAGRRLIYLERLRIYSLAAAYSQMNNFVSFIHSLRVLELPWGRFGNVQNMMSGIGAVIDKPSDIVTTATNLDNAIRGYSALGNFTANSCTSMVGGFAYDKLKSIGTVTATSVTTASAAFQATYNFTGQVILDMPLVQSLNNMFNASAVQSVTFGSCAAVTTTTTMFSLATNIQNVVMPNLTRGVSFANTPMSNSGMSNFANSIGTASGAQTITVTGTPFGALLTALDATAVAIRNVMTGKGYTVVN